MRNQNKFCERLLYSSFGMVTASDMIYVQTLAVVNLELNELPMHSQNPPVAWMEFLNLRLFVRI